MVQIPEDHFSVRGKNVLVTGANRGIGKAIALKFAQCGANVGLMCRDPGRAAPVLAEMRQYGGVYKAFGGNVGDKQDCARVIREFCGTFGRFDALVNNAGTCRHVDTFDMGPSFEAWDEVMRTNLDGVFYMCYYAGQVMKRQRGGSITNISSPSDTMVNIPQWQCSYNSSKAGVTQLSQCLAVEWSPYNVRVNVAEPGLTETDMLMQENEREREWKKFWDACMPSARLVRPNELASVCVFLASDDAEYVRGATVICSGACHLPR